MSYIYIYFWALFVSPKENKKEYSLRLVNKSPEALNMPLK
jgi:hypothetical protein